MPRSPCDVHHDVRPGAADSPDAGCHATAAAALQHRGGKMGQGRQPGFLTLLDLFKRPWSKCDKVRTQMMDKDA